MIEILGIIGVLALFFILGMIYGEVKTTKEYDKLFAKWWVNLENERKKEKDNEADN